MAGHYDHKTGQSKLIKLTCPTGKRCLLKRALYLRRQYFLAIFYLESINKKYGQRLQMAEFVSEVCRAAAKEKKISEDVWKNLRRTPIGGEATSYEDTWLKKDIEKMKNAITSAKDRVDKRSKRLIKFLDTKVFNKHMVKYHCGPLPPEIVKSKYDVDLPKTSSSKYPEYREIDHYLAILTENLAITTSGQEFLHKFSDEKWLSKRVAFADVWGYLGKFNNATEPIGKFIYNWSPVISLKIQEVIKKGKVRTINDILLDPDLKIQFDFLEKKLKLDIQTWLEKKAAIYEKGASKAARNIRYRGYWRKAAQQWMQEGSKRFDPQYAAKIRKQEHHLKLDNLWIGITLDGVAFAISAIKIATDLKNAKWNDFLGAVNDLTGLSKTLLEGRQSYLVLRGADYELKAAQAAKMAKVMGVIGGLMTAFLSAYEAYKGLQRKDWEVVALHAAGVGLAIGGTIAIIMEMSVLSGVLMVLGIILAIIMAIVLDPKIIDFIEDIEWGEKRNVKVRDTMIHYYKELFSISVNYYIDQYDNNNSYIQIESNLLSNTTPVFVEIIREKDKKNLGKFRVYPGYKKVRNKGRVTKLGPAWSVPWPNYGRRLKIMDVWDIWPGIIRDDTTEYTIKAGLDPSHDPRMKIDKMALNDSDTDVEFPKRMKPMLLKTYSSKQKLFFPPTKAIKISGEWKRYLYYSPTSPNTTYVYTRYAKNCRIKVTIKEDRFLSPWETDISFPISGSRSYNNYLRTPIDIKFKAPPPAGEYRVNLKYELFDKNGKSHGAFDVYIDVAYADYINRRT